MRTTKDRKKERKKSIKGQGGIVGKEREIKEHVGKGDGDEKEIERG